MYKTANAPRFILIIFFSTSFLKICVCCVICNILVDKNLPSVLFVVIYYIITLIYEIFVSHFVYPHCQ